MTRIQPDSQYGHLRRSEQAQDRRKQALQHTKELCQNAWDTFIEENQSADAITDEQIYDLYEYLYKEIEQTVSAHLLPFALFERMRFFDRINDTRKKDTCRYCQLLVRFFSVYYMPHRQC